MSTIYTRPSTPSPDDHRYVCTDPDCGCNTGAYADAYANDDSTHTESRKVIQEFNTPTGLMKSMFTIEADREDGTIKFKVFDQHQTIHLVISYDTADELQRAISDAMDELEEAMGVRV